MQENHIKEQKTLLKLKLKLSLSLSLSHLKDLSVLKSPGVAPIVVVAEVEDKPVCTVMESVLTVIEGNGLEAESVRRVNAVMLSKLIVID